MSEAGGAPRCDNGHGEGASAGLPGIGTRRRDGRTGATGG